MKQLLLIAITSTCLAALAPAVAAQQGPPQGAQAPQPVLVDEQQPVLRVSEGRLTLRVRSVRLGWILDQLTQKAKVAVLAGKGAGSELVTMDLQDTPLDEALRQMVRHHECPKQGPGDSQSKSHKYALASSQVHKSKGGKV